MTMRKALVVSGPIVTSLKFQLVIEEGEKLKIPGCKNEQHRGYTFA